MVPAYQLRKNEAENDTARQRTQNQGFATLILLFFAPVTITAFIVLSSTALLVKEYLLRSKQCRVHSLQTLAKVEKNVNQLFTKNKTALNLRTRYQRTQILLGAATAVQNYPKVAYYTAQLAKLYAQRLSLDLWQKAKITETENYLRQGQSAIQRMPKTQMKTSKPVLDINRDLPGLAPQYFPGVLFERRILLDANYSFQIQSVFPRVLLESMNAFGVRKNIRIKGQCTAGLELRGHEWRAAMKK